MTIKVFEKTAGCMPNIIKVGDWIDLITAESIELKVPHAGTLHKYRKENKENRLRDVEFTSTLIPLGVCIEVPKGYESVLVVRSSTFKKWGILQTNSIGVIDQSYCSEKDEWKLPVIATRSVFIPKGTKIAQFRVQLSQKATFWQKLKWLFSKTIKIKQVEFLNNKERGGFGSTDNNIKD